MPKDSLNQIAEFVKNRLFETAAQLDDPNVDPVYRWQHTLRVANIGKQIAEAEGANVEWVLAACLLHDAAHFDDRENYIDHGRLAAEISRPLLTELGYDPQAVDAICYAVAVHVDDQAGFEHPHTIEADVVSDADNVDRFGAYRLLQFCQPGIGDFDALVEQAELRLPSLSLYQAKGVMSTKTGQVLFNKEVDRQIAFFEALQAQKEITTLPEFE